jgi:hypothetical protein
MAFLQPLAVSENNWIFTHLQVFILALDTKNLNI